MEGYTYLREEMIMTSLINRFIDRFLGWMSAEPFIGLLMIVTAIVLFATVINPARTNRMRCGPGSAALLNPV